MSSVHVHYLNHASLLVEVGGVRMLFDPWLEGTAFSGGWGLRYDNPEAVQLGATATHLWISHWHSDHLHAPTLSKIAQLNPDMVVLANVSANFSMVDRMESFGFRDVRPIGERQSIELNGQTTCCRYPTAGIDNMLHIASGSWSILNYNDCNLPAKAIQSLRKHMGPIDLLFTNYNHAGKLFDVVDDETRKEQLSEVLELTLDALEASRVVPFASNHYYRAEVSADQNASMLDFDDLENLAGSDERYVILRIGDQATFDAPTSVRVSAREPALVPQKLEVHDYGPAVPWDELLEEVSVRSKALRGQFLHMGKLAVPDLVVRVSDHGRNLRLSIGKEAREADPGDSAHIEAHSQAMRVWLARRFGDDTFIAGAHFRVLDPDTSVIERWALVTLLEASHLDPQSCLHYLGARDGRRFLWNRREEILATLLGRRVKAGRVRI
ncbi:MBL fold metallo-hydrolase [Deltaproteobacteria bacterium]|nr:MBL fold metallo-hydrolase [Deltaproteobacteria bacterium]